MKIIEKEIGTGQTKRKKEYCRNSLRPADVTQRRIEENNRGVFWYLLLGAGIGALIYGFFPQDLVVRLAEPENLRSIPIAAAIGVPMYIRAETIIPISAALVGKGMGVGTILPHRR